MYALCILSTRNRSMYDYVLARNGPHLQKLNEEVEWTQGWFKIMRPSPRIIQIIYVY